MSRTATNSASPRDPGDSEGSDYGSAVEQLLARMRSGDRNAAAQFITDYGPRIRRRVRGKLSPSMRRIFDSQEILSTLGRRLDQYVKDRKIEAGTKQQLWALVYRMANNAVIDKVRIFQRLQRVEGEDGEFARELLGRLHRAEAHPDLGIEVELEKALSLFDDSLDRQILSLWLVGTGHHEIAVLVDVAPPAVRKRWQRIRERLQDRFSNEMHE